MPTTRIRSNTLVFATDLLKTVHKNLGHGQLVTPFRWEDKDGETVLEFEIRVTKVGSAPVPRNRKTLPELANLKDPR